MRDFSIPNNIEEYEKYFQNPEQKRYFDMFRKYMLVGTTYQSIWDEYWITRERVRQILNKIHRHILSIKI